jgi:hypothetical protein
MKQETLKAANFSLDQVKDRFEHWRATRPKRGRIPEALWEAAVDLTRDYAISRVAKTLRLSYTDLKRRVHNKIPAEAPAVKADAVADFIEIEMPISKEGSGLRRECIVEMEDGQGDRMRMCFAGGVPFDPLELGRAFWGRDT